MVKTWSFNSPKLDTSSVAVNPAQKRHPVFDSPYPSRGLFKKDLLQRFSRFLWFRQGYSLLQGLIQSQNPQYYTDQLEMHPHSPFDTAQIDRWVAEMRQEAVSFGLQLPQPMVQQILHHATATPCVEPGYEGEFFIKDVGKDGRLSPERTVLRALVRDTEQCSAIEKLVRDPVLLTLVRRYLGYYPRQITRHLTWSCVTDLPPEERSRRYLPTQYHYDIAGYNFMTAYFYITDVDADSGPHMMIKRSHLQKPLKMLLSSGRQSEQTIFQHYKTKDLLSIQGPAGFGFVQDPSCFHKVQPPKTHHRLLLQIRYS